MFEGASYQATLTVTDFRGISSSNSVYFTTEALFNSIDGDMAGTIFMAASVPGNWEAAQYVQLSATAGAPAMLATVANAYQPSLFFVHGSQRIMLAYTLQDGTARLAYSDDYGATLTEIGTVWDATYLYAKVSGTLDGGCIGVASKPVGDSFATYFKYSPDGIDWSASPLEVVTTAQPTVFDILQRIAHGRTGLVATDGMANWLTSDDYGRTWTNTPITNWDSSFANGIGDGINTASTLDGGFASIAAKDGQVFFKYSPDGFDWSAAPVVASLQVTGGKGLPLWNVMQLWRYRSADIKVLQGYGNGPVTNTSHDYGRTWESG